LIEEKATKHLGEIAEQFDSFLVETCASRLKDDDPKSDIQVGIGLFYFQRKLND